MGNVNVKCGINIIEKGASTEITRENFLLDQQGITNWLRSKNIINDNEILTSFSDIFPWTRTGGETYSASFKFTSNQQSKQLFIKAIVTMSPERSLADWSRRREILSKEGIPVSNWYHHSGAVIFEDYYPNTSSNVNFEKILKIGYKLDKLGFSTLKFSKDIRADKENNPFFIDFGFDLGEPSPKNKTSAQEYLIKQYPEKSEEIVNFYAENQL